MAQRLQVDREEVFDMIGSRPLQDSEIETILSNLALLRDKTWVLIGIKCGFRISEILSLRVENIMQYGVVADQITVNRCNMKGKTSSRTVPLHPQAKKALEEYVSTLKIVEPKTRLFPFTRSNAHKILAKAFKQAKLMGKVSSHSLRKTYCAKVHKALGENIFKTQIAMGHANPGSTVHYLSFCQDEINSAILGT